MDCNIGVDDEQYDTPWEFKSRAVSAALSGGTAMRNSRLNCETVLTTGSARMRTGAGAAHKWKDSIEVHDSMSSSTSSSLIASVNGIAAARKPVLDGEVSTYPGWLPTRPSVSTADAKTPLRAIMNGGSRWFEQLEAHRPQRVGPSRLSFDVGKTLKSEFHHGLSQESNEYVPPVKGGGVEWSVPRRDEHDCHIHDGIDRTDSERLLKSMEAGCFLLRRRPDGSLALSLKATEGVLHIKLELRNVHNKGPCWILGEGPRFNNVSAMIRCYKKTPLPVRGAEHIRLKSLLSESDLSSLR